MQREELNIQTLTDNEDIRVGYSDEDIVIIDSIQKFTEAKAARVSMSAVAICTSGKIQAQMGERKIELTENQVVIVPHNTMITDIMVSPDFDLKAMFFTNAILQSFLREKMHVWNEMMYIQEMRVLTLNDIADVQFFTSFYELLQHCFAKPADMPYRTDVIQSLLRGAMLGLCGALKRMLPTDSLRHGGNGGVAHFQHFLDLLHAEGNKHRTVESYAGELCISPKYLSSVCKKHSGKTANEWITEAVVEDIRYYLCETDLSIKQISDRLGFPNPSFFGKFVKEHLGVPPMQYRQNRLAG